MQPNRRSSVNVGSGRPQPGTAAGVWTRRPYLPATAITIAIALVGFWPTYFGPAFAGTLAVPSVIHVHAAVYVTWLLLFGAQVAFAATGRIRLHVRVGRWIVLYGLVLVGAGLMAAGEGFGARLAAGDAFRAQRWLFGVLRDLVFFVPFLAAGWIYRRHPEIHKRLMMVATVILVVPAVSRMSYLGVPVPLWTFMVIWPLPLYMAMVHDFGTKRLVHPVYIIGIMAMLTMRLVLPLGSSHRWQAMAGKLATLYGTPAGKR